MAVSLTFAAAYIIFQFGILFWFLSRPRKYTVTPDDPQIGMSFENYRGQPDLLEHAKSTVGILQGVKEFELRGGEMPKGMLLSGRRERARRSSPRASRPRRNLPFIYIDASSLRGMFIGHDRADDHEAVPRRSRPRPQVRASTGSAVPASCSWTRSTRSA